MRQSQLILSNAAVLWAMRILVLVPQLVLVPYLIGTIGEAGYGVYALVWSLVISLDQLERSLQSGVVKYTAGFIATGRVDEVSKVVSSSFVYSLFLAIVASMAVLAMAVLYGDPSGRIGRAMAVVAVLVLFVVPLTPYVGVIQAKQHYYVGALVDAFFKYVSMCSVIAWFQLISPSVEALIVIMAGMLLLSRLAQVPVAYRLVPGLRNHVSLFDGSHFRLVASFGMGTVLASLCLAANSTGLRWLMDALTSTVFVAHLAIMTMPGALLSQIVTAMTITVMPATSAYNAVGNSRLLQELLVRGTRYTTLLGLACLVLASLSLKPMLVVWVGADYLFLAPYAIALLAAVAFANSASVSHHMLKGMGRLRSIVIIYAIGLVLVPVGVILSVFYIWHSPYVAVCTGLVAGHLLTGCLQVRFAAKAVHADPQRLVLQGFVQPFAMALAVMPVVYGFLVTGHFESLAERLGISLVVIVVLFGGCYLLIATKAERDQVKTVLEWMHSCLSNLRMSTASHRE